MDVWSEVQIRRPAVLLFEQLIKLFVVPIELGFPQRRLLRQNGLDFRGGPRITLRFAERLAVLGGISLYDAVKEPHDGHGSVQNAGQLGLFDGEVGRHDGVWPHLGHSRFLEGVRRGWPKHDLAPGKSAVDGGAGQAVFQLQHLKHFDAQPFDAVMRPIAPVVVHGVDDGTPFFVPSQLRVQPMGRVAFVDDPVGDFPVKFPVQDRRCQNFVAPGRVSDVVVAKLLLDVLPIPLRPPAVRFRDGFHDRPPASYHVPAGFRGGGLVLDPVVQVIDPQARPDHGNFPCVDVRL